MNTQNLNEIKPTYVTFEQAKLLKEKGFNEPCTHLYCIGYNSVKEDTELRPNKVINDHGQQIGIRYRKVNNDQPHLALAPEQHQVIEWLRVEKGIWIYVVGGGNHQFYPIYQDKSGDKHEIMQFYYTPQEAYSAVFDFIFKELI
jgi:hypothetical protein